MTNEELYQELDQTLAAFPEAVASFASDQLDVVPFEGSWTAGQVAEHMILANSGFVELVNGPVKDTDREPDKNVDSIRQAFLDFSTKMKSPDFVLPVRNVHEKEQLLEKLEKIRQGVLAAVKAGDLSKICTGSPLPVLGHLTRLEALHFVLYHTQRHIHQLKNIRLVLV